MTQRALIGLCLSLFAYATWNGLVGNMGLAWFAYADAWLAMRVIQKEGR
jgi:hypothetical protein